MAIFPFRAVIFGPEHIEKSTVLKKLANPDYQQPAENCFVPIIGCEFHPLNSSRAKIQLWAVSGDRRYALMASTLVRNTSMGIFCVNLNQIDAGYDCAQLIADYVEPFQAENPDKPIILVVTQSESTAEQQKVLAALKRHNAFTTVIINPCQQNTELLALQELIIAQAELEEQITFIRTPPTQLTPYFTIRDKIPRTTTLYHLLNELALLAYQQSPALKEQIEREVNTLVTGLISAEVEDKYQLSINFLQQCTALLPQKNHAISRAILAVAISALIIVTAGAAGFSLGSALASIYSPQFLVISRIISSLSCAAYSAWHAIPYSYGAFFKPTAIESQLEEVSGWARYFSPDEQCYA